MALKLGAYTACLHDRPLEAALGVLGANGLTSVEDVGYSRLDGLALAAANLHAAAAKL
jgi:hypothetical protein